LTVPEMAVLSTIPINCKISPSFNEEGSFESKDQIFNAQKYLYYQSKN